MKNKCFTGFFQIFGLAF